MQGGLRGHPRGGGPGGLPGPINLEGTSSGQRHQCQPGEEAASSRSCSRRPGGERGPPVPHPRVPPLPSLTFPNGAEHRDKVSSQSGPTPPAAPAPSCLRQSGPRRTTKGGWFQSTEPSVSPTPRLPRHPSPPLPRQPPVLPRPAARPPTRARAARVPRAVAPMAVTALPAPVLRAVPPRRRRPITTPGPVLGVLIRPCSLRRGRGTGPRPRAVGGFFGELDPAAA